MARPLRIEYKGAFYHITARGNERKRSGHLFQGRYKAILVDAASGVERIIDAVADHFEVSPEDVLKDKREIRNIAVYLIKKWTSVTNGQTVKLLICLGV